MKNKKVYVILIVLILIGSIFLTYNIYQNKNKVIKTKKNKQNNLAIMIKEDGATDYTKSNSKDIPKGDYTLNYEKSYCKNNGVIGDYDSVLGKVSFSFVGTDSCFLYFDYKATYLYDVIEQRYNEDKTYLGLYTGEGADTYANPVYYYKGNVQNNNVLFGNYCWKIVRTTETGGVKLIFNGSSTTVSDSYKKLDESNYYIENDANYPFIFDDINKVWKSNNTDTSGEGTENTIIIGVDDVGTYLLNVEVHNDSGEDYVDIYYHDSLVGSCSSNEYCFDGSNTSIFNTGNPVPAIKIVYHKFSTSNDGSDYVEFHIERGVGNNKEVCVQNGTNTQIGTSTIYKQYNSPAYLGYMNNIIYNSNYKNIDLNHSLGVRSGNSVTYSDSISYSDGKYILINSKNTIYNMQNSFKGKYVCEDLTSTSCSSVHYIVREARQNSILVLYTTVLSNGDIDVEGESNLSFGTSFTYENGKYYLSNTIKIDISTWSKTNTDLNTHHYSCLYNGTVCEKLYYIYLADSNSIFYIELTGGKSVDDALNEMLYNDAVNTTNSTIKTTIDTWYKNNLIYFSNKLEDTVFCNDRSRLSPTGDGWYPNGGSIGSALQFKNYNISTSLKCENQNDKFTVESSNGNGKLTYPIGLLTAPEAKLANYGSENYLNSGSAYWLLTPCIYSNMVASMYTLDSSNFNIDTVNASKGVRPVISLKPKISISSGDGSFTSPFVISKN